MSTHSKQTDRHTNTHTHTDTTKTLSLPYTREVTKANTGAFFLRKRIEKFPLYSGMSRRSLNKCNHRMSATKSVNYCVPALPSFCVHCTGSGLHFYFLFKQLVFSDYFYWQENIANLPNLPHLHNWLWPMKESINLIGGLLGYVCQHDLFESVQLLNMSNVWCEKYKWLNSYVLI